MSRLQSMGEELANSITHIVGSHLGAAMLALVVWQGAMSGVDVAWKVTSGAIFGASIILICALSFSSRRNCMACMPFGNVHGSWRRCNMYKMRVCICHQQLREGHRSCGNVCGGQVHTYLKKPAYI